MKKIQSVINSYDNVSREIKFLATSKIRLNILNSLVESPKSAKELSFETGMEYSSISRAMNQLRAHNMVYRVDSKYHVINSLKFLLPDLFELADIVSFLNRIFNILDEHDVTCLPDNSIMEIPLLFEVQLIESLGMDPFKIDGYIVDALGDANSARCILPFYDDNFAREIKNLVKNHKVVELIVHSTIYRSYKKNTKVKHMTSFRNKNNFLLIITNQLMILGFFKNDGDFDQNRLLISNTRNSIKWANNLFRYKKGINE